MEQQRALNALEPFIALSKSATSPRAAADLITQATSAAQTYVFAELLHTPNIQALRDSPDHLPHLRLLEIFSWGSYADYKSASPNLPALNDQQHHKLQLLSLLPLCSSPGTLSYTALQSALGLSADQALESLVTAAIYENLLTAHLDPLHRTVRVTSVAPLRDPSPNSIPAFLSTLDDWELKCQRTLKDIEAQIAEIRAAAQISNAREAQTLAQFEAALAAFERSEDNNNPVQPDGAAGAGRGKKLGGKWVNLLGKGGKRAAPMEGAGGGGGEAMDVDDQGASLKGGVSRATKRKGPGTR